jgi:hypothetical protein
MVHETYIVYLKVVENYSYLNGEYQLPPAYQYFENVRNFLVALETLRLPGFEASDLEKVTHFEIFFLIVSYG